ncbi:MAG: hypothetical protein KIT31_14280, partial [Deltaproteobacteria bacterium]|nr:hypothetical protein [Deltaproteobacteria bacterium]
MRVIAVVEPLREVRLVPDGVTYELLGVPIEPGAHVVLELPGLAELTDSAMTRWLAVHHHSGEHRVPTELFGGDYRLATLADFLDAANARAFAARLPALFGQDAHEQLANAEGGQLLR